MEALNKIGKLAAPAMFILVLFTNYLSAIGLFVPLAQAEVSAEYTNLLAPAGFTFSIWSVIYLGVALSLSLEFLNSSSHDFLDEYESKIRPLFIEWMVLNIMWIFTWSYELLFVSMAIIFIYARTLKRISQAISNSSSLSKKKWLLKLPVGLHFGWLIVANFANLTTLFVSIGLSGTGTTGAIWAIISLIIILVIAIYYTNSHANIAIILPSLWALIGVIAKQAPNSSFQYANTTVFGASVSLLVLGIGITVYLVWHNSK